MIARSPSAVSKPCRPPPNSSPTRAMTAKPCATGWQNAEPRPSSHRARTARSNTIMTRPSTGSATFERMFCRLKDWRRIATRFDRNIKNFSPQSPLPPPSSGGCNELVCDQSVLVPRFHCFITVAECDLFLPLSLTKRLVNHTRPSDIGTDYCSALLTLHSSTSHDDSEDLHGTRPTGGENVQYASRSHGPDDVHGQAGSCLAIGQAAAQYRVSGEPRNALIAALALEQPLFDPDRKLLWLLPRIGF